MKERIAHLLFDALIAVSTHSLSLALAIDSKYGLMADMLPPLPEEDLTPVKAAPQSRPAAFLNGRGQEIPYEYGGEHPEYGVFKMMFERRFGFGGKCPLTISGMSRTYNVDELYTFMSNLKAKPEDDKTPLEKALYSAVMHMILLSFGDTTEGATLN